MNYVVYLKSRYNLRFQWLSDLELLAMAGYLSFEWNRSGMAKLYRVSEMGLSVLNDPDFITAADYSETDEVGEPFSLIDSSTASPSPPEMVRELLYADFRRLTHLLKELPKSCLTHQEWDGMTVEVEKILANLEENTLIPSEIIKGVDSIGRCLQRALAEHIGTEKGETASQILVVYGLWCSRIQEELASFKKTA